MDNETRQYLVLGRSSKPQQSASKEVTSHQVRPEPRPEPRVESRSRVEADGGNHPTRLSQLNSTRLDWAGPGWAGLNLALRRLASQQAVEPRPFVLGVPSSPSNKRKQSDCVPFLNGILLATEENHTATVLVPCPVLIRRCYMLPSLPRPESSSPALLLHDLGSTYLPLLCASCQRPILPSSATTHPATLPPRPTLPLSVQYAHRHLPHIAPLHTDIHTHLHTRTHTAIPPPSVPNYGKAKSASSVIPTPQHSRIGRSTQPVQLYKTREQPGRGVCSATLLCMKTRTTRTTPNPSLAADHTQVPILAVQPFPAPICFSTPAHLAQH